MNEQVFSPEGTKNLEAFSALLEIDEKERSFQTKQGYVSAYVLSVLLPPIGIYYLIKYFFFSDGTPDSRRAGVISCVLTLSSLGIGLFLFNVLIGSMSVGSSLKNTDSLKEIMTPESQKAVMDLLK